MQETKSKTFTFWVFLVPVTDVGIVETNTDFLAYLAWCTGQQSAFFITIAISDLTQVLVLLL